MTDDFPTPPFPDATAITRVVAGISVSGAFSRAFQRARAMSALRSSCVISPISTPTVSTPGNWRTRASTSFWI